METISSDYCETISSAVNFQHKEQPGRLHFTSEEIERILVGCRLNQRAEQKELYIRYYGYAMSISQRYSLNKYDTVEMINDAFLKIFRDLKNFTQRNGNTASSFTGWVKKVMISACIDHLRKYNKWKMMNAFEPQYTALADKSETAEQSLHHKEIMKCIQYLSPAYKAVFNLYVIEGFSHAEIAEKMNITEGTSKSNLHKARYNLRQFLVKRNSVYYELAE